MDRGFYWRVGFIVASALLAIWLLVPSVYYFQLPADERNVPEKLEAVLPHLDYFLPSYEDLLAIYPGRDPAAMIRLLRDKGAKVAYNDPYFAHVGQGRHYDLNMNNTPLDNLGQYDAVVIVTDHSAYDFKAIVDESQLVVDTRNATKGINSPKIVRC